MGATAAQAAATPVSVEAPATQDCGIQAGRAAQCASGSVAVGIGSEKVWQCSDACQWVTRTAVARGLFAFDLGGVPAGAEIVSAQLRAWVTTRGSASALPVQARPLVNRWTNAATWTDYDTFSPWLNAGGDVGPPVATRSITGPGQYYRFDITGLVREWTAGVRPNLGLLLKRTIDDDAGQVDAAWLESLESTTAARRPVLEIVYEPGTPPNVSLSGVLWDERDVDLADDRSDAGYIDTDESLHVSATEGAPGAGVASIEMRVDGVRLRPEHLVSTCCTASAGADFVFHRADVAAGDRTVRVYVRDAQAAPDSTTPGAHVAVRGFVVTAADVVSVDDGDYEDVPPPGSGEPASPLRAMAAPSLLSATAATDTRSRIASEAARPGSDLRKLLGGAQYAIEDLGVMSQGADASGNPRVVGTVAILRLAQPRAVDATIGCYRPQRDSGAIVPYQARVRATALRDLLVRMDLGGTILCASPGPTSDADVQAVPGQPPLPAASED